MRMSAKMLAVMAATLLIAPAGAQDKKNPPREAPVQESAKTAKELQKERIAVLKELTQQLTQLYQNARADIDELLEARVQLLQAQLDAAEQPDRLTLYQKLVDELKQYEEIAQARLEAGQASTASVLKVKARRLEAEIRLNEAKARESQVQHQKTVVARPQVANVTVTQQYAAQIQARRHIEIRALETGYVETIPVQEGQAVKRGDLFFNLAPNLHKARLDVELGDVKIVEQELQNARRLFENKVVGPNEVALLETKLAKAKARAELARAELNLTEVRAPFDGIVDRLRAQEGSMVKEGETLTTLSDNSAIWVYFNVPESRYLEYLADPGTEKAAEVELVLANGSKFEHRGAISAIEAEFNRGAGTIPFRADFPNPGGVLRHGMTGNVIIRQPLTSAVVIPQRATFQELGKRYVFVVNREDVAHWREIVVKYELDDFFIVADGVGAEDRIVVEGTQGVHPGEKVEYEFRPPEQFPGRQ